MYVPYHTDCAVYVCCTDHYVRRLRFGRLDVLTDGWFDSSYLGVVLHFLSIRFLSMVTYVTHVDSIVGGFLFVHVNRLVCRQYHLGTMYVHLTGLPSLSPLLYIRTYIHYIVLLLIGYQKFEPRYWFLSSFDKQ